MAQPMKTLLDHFGMQWFEAKGEAEAELACFNQEGKIDAIMTDDVDGAQPVRILYSCLIRQVNF